MQYREKVPEEESQEIIILFQTNTKQERKFHELHLLASFSARALSAERSGLLLQALATPISRRNFCFKGLCNFRFQWVLHQPLRSFVVIRRRNGYGPRKNAFLKGALY
ncbi:hypothetical protein NE237_004153 [Protea cynaroides]|uniref:Uncharacterized protein n=1 Tax=Protea cynaroides TaxID=273540 RepID=A0A9Q0QTE3_9MAGN|nr:hypothetical protein NE237_004153 [Protea cynaroides]